MTLVHRGRTDAYLEWGDAWICLLEKEGHALYPTSLGMDHVAFSVDETTFHLLVEKITKQTKKVIRAPVNRGGGLSFQFLDPDDIILEFYTGNLHQRMKSWK